RVQLESVNETFASFGTALDIESDNGTGAVGTVLAAALKPGAGGDAGVRHGLNVFVAFEPLGNRDGIADVTLNTQAQRLDTLGNQEGVERRDGRAQIAQQLNPCLEDVGQIGTEGTTHAEVTG